MRHVGISAASKRIAAGGKRISTAGHRASYRAANGFETRARCDGFRTALRNDDGIAAGA